MDQQPSNIANQIREFVAKNLLFSDGGFNYDNEASFLDEGIVDSLGVIELVTFVEQQFGISVADDELVPDNFDSVTKMEAYIRQKIATGT
jgi:acyl carrier protein